MSAARTILVRNLLLDRTYVYSSRRPRDRHYCPFWTIANFESLYDEMVESWAPARRAWRMWLEPTRPAVPACCPAISPSSALGGAGRVYDPWAHEGRGEHRFFLFDTFTGSPTEPAHRRVSASKVWAESEKTSVAHVYELIAPGGHGIAVSRRYLRDARHYRRRRLSFAHIDLHAAAPSGQAIAFAVRAPWLRPRDIVFDVYRGSPTKDQRLLIDEFFREQPEMPSAADIRHSASSLRSERPAP